MQAWSGVSGLDYRGQLLVWECEPESTYIVGDLLQALEWNGLRAESVDSRAEMICKAPTEFVGAAMLLDIKLFSGCSCAPTVCCFGVQFAGARVKVDRTV